MGYKDKLYTFTGDFCEESYQSLLSMQNVERFEYLKSKNIKRCEQPITLEKFLSYFPKGQEKVFNNPYKKTENKLCIFWTFDEINNSMKSFFNDKEIQEIIKQHLQEKNGCIILPTFCTSLENDKYYYHRFVIDYYWKDGVDCTVENIFPIHIPVCSDHDSYYKRKRRSLILE